MLFKCVGPMPVSQFMAEFTPGSGPTKPTTARFKLDIPQAESHTKLEFEAVELCPHIRFSSVPMIDNASTPSDSAQHKTCIIALSDSQPPSIPSQSTHPPPFPNSTPELLIDYDNEPEVNGMHKVAFLSGGLVRLGQLRGHLNEPCYNLLVELRELFWCSRYAYDSDIPTKERKEKEHALESSDRILAMFDAAVEGDGWTDGDGSRDMVKEIRERTNLRKSTRAAYFAAKRTASDAFGGCSDEQASGSRKKQRSDSSGTPDGQTSSQ
ncbi:hypothetical protein OF83DRAFT_1089120 [Amylostereum chailletii]|nr:hypothetical protein OF83DRAFT_1089120 [Amylostereum chailletii]